MLGDAYSLPLPLSPAYNTTGLLFLLFASITLNFPLETPVTSQSMNYISAAIGLLAMLSITKWFTSAAKRFIGIRTSLPLTGLTAHRTLVRRQEDKRSCMTYST